MRAVVCQHGQLSVTQIADPDPGPGQLLIDVHRCGICGSDLHARTQMDQLAPVLELCGYDRYMRSDQQVVMGHEIYGVVAGCGPDVTGRMPVGTPVVAIPMVRRAWQIDGVGLSAAAPGGYAEQVVVQEAFTIPVPAGMDPDIAAMTEPMAIAWHAVERSEVGKRDVAIVLGCGPVGLATIAVLTSRGVRRIIASDPSPARRTLAERCGAHTVVDPAAASPYEAAAAHGFVETMPQEINAGIDALDQLNKLPVPWWTTWRALDALGKTKAPAPIVFECVGLPGMIDGVLAEAPLHTRVVVIGVCMGADAIRPSLAINKEIDLRFVVGYSPLEFRDTLHALASGRLDAAPIVTGRVGLDGVAAAFDELGHGSSHAKVLIDPTLTSDRIVSEKRPDAGAAVDRQRLAGDPSGVIRE